MTVLESILAEIRQRADAEPARALPPGAYRDPELHALERDRIFAVDWQCAGLAAEIPEPGDYLTFAINDQPIVVVRGDDGVVRSFSNVCLHRMMRLADGRGRCRKFTCPYHAWTYDLNGRLVAAPHMRETPGFRVADHALPAVRTELWEGWIYVTLNPAAPATATLFGPLRDLVGRYEMAGYVPFVTQDHVWATNWKILTENFMEGYHLPVSHRATVGAWMPIDSTRFPPAVGGAYTVQTFAKIEGAGYGLAHPDNRRLKDEWRATSVMPTVFPCHMYVLAPDHLWYLSLRPKGVGEVHIRFGAAFAPEAWAALPDRATTVAETVAFFDRVNAEDRGVVEAVYANTAAPLAAGGRLSWLERELTDFARYLASRLADGRAAERAQR